MSTITTVTGSQPNRTPSSGGMDWLKYAKPENWHPAAAAFPRMSDAELRELAADIQKNGLHHKITVLDGKVLDGINRVLALQILQAESNGELEVSHGEFTTLTGSAVFDVYTSTGGKNLWVWGSPVVYVISQNLHRRQLTFEQKVALGVRLKRLLTEEGKERRQENLKQGTEKPESTGAVPSGKSAAVAATKVGAGRESIELLDAEDREVPGTLEKVESGKMTVAGVRWQRNERKNRERFQRRGCQERLRGLLERREQEQKPPLKPNDVYSACAQHGGFTKNEVDAAAVVLGVIRYEDGWRLPAPAIFKSTNKQAAAVIPSNQQQEDPSPSAEKEDVEDKLLVPMLGHISRFGGTVPFKPWSYSQECTFLYSVTTSQFTFTIGDENIESVRGEMKSRFGKVDVSRFEQMHGDGSRFSAYAELSATRMWLAETLERARNLQVLLRAFQELAKELKESAASQIDNLQTVELSTSLNHLEHVITALESISLKGIKVPTLKTADSANGEPPTPPPAAGPDDIDEMVGVAAKEAAAVQTLESAEAPQAMAVDSGFS